MLRRLTIRDFVIVDRLELDFRPGFGTLTGETGAGKSILLDALGLALGGRGDAATVRVGKERADIVAEFDLPPQGGLGEWLTAQEVPVDDDQVLLRRVVDAGGRSRAWINGVPVTLGQLREAGEWLADIHGQHAHHALLRADAQRALLDARADASALAAEVAGLYREWMRLARCRREAEHDSEASARQHELLAWQVRELEELAFEPSAWAELNMEQSRLAHAASLIEAAEEALVVLGEGELSVTSQLQRIGARVQGMAEIDSALADAGELLAGAAIQADEALHGLRRYRDRIEVDPARLEEVDGRIGAVTDIARKYRIAPEEIPELLERSRRDLAELSERADPQRLEAQEREARERYMAAAGRLSRERVSAARTLSREVSDAMQTLAMAGGAFEVGLEPCPEGSMHGLELVEFRVAANPNQSLRPLAKVASGGELSRIGLAIQVMTSRDSATPTLVFDEVDVGIGGSVAEIVGHLLHQLGRDRQVMCVTHLPQVAACADWQWSIAKMHREGEVVSSVRDLDREGRIDEIARMLGGVNITDTTRRHAAEMLGALAVPGS